MKNEILLGKTTEHLVPFPGTKFFIHQEVLSNFLKLKEDAALAGFDLSIISAFRDYDRQLKIWNLKALGERQLLDDQERPLDFYSLSPREIMFAILRWSALPGCSRHHWGTDIDVYDAKTQKPEDVQLVPSETMNDGPAARLHEWLDQKISTQDAYGFYRPYATDRGGVAPERWHLSYSPLSSKFLQAFTLDLFKQNIFDSDILLKDELLQNANEIYQRFLTNIDAP